MIFDKFCSYAKFIKKKKTSQGPEPELPLFLPVNTISLGHTVIAISRSAKTALAGGRQFGLGRGDCQLRCNAFGKQQVRDISANGFQPAGLEHTIKTGTKFVPVFTFIPAEILIPAFRFRALPRALYATKPTAYPPTGYRWDIAPTHAPW